ncbi:Down syndrome cell adhesion molecule-like protein Dscam2 [Frankliniella fusca]|uniref:Down syndrome cell adhesion molecule-like protein Dscam2 n=1 Tax=Frankliniella fusca TaxID=407009 RepID=A0AAE1LIV1_9NEOP|nr:Down syndrome cell adhesion molecule-like protein Dscam2 [Frankliniella fusca]
MHHSALEALSPDLLACRRWLVVSVRVRNRRRSRVTDLNALSPGVAVVLQSYEVAVVSQPVSRGNAAVLRCAVPSLVKDYVTVTSWLQDQSFNIYPSKDGVRSTPCRRDRRRLIIVLLSRRYCCKSRYSYTVKKES